MKAKVNGAKRLIAIAAWAVMCSCGGETVPVAPSSMPPPAPGNVPPSVPITSLEISVAPPALTLPVPSPLAPVVWTVVGQTTQLAVRAGTSNSPPQDVTNNVSWSVTGSNIATVSSSGLVTALSAGVTPLRAIYEGRTATTFLTVFGGPVTTIESFTHVIELRQRRPYFVNAGAGTGIGFMLSNSGPGSGLVGMMFGTADGFTCRSPYLYGGNAFQSVSTSTGRAAHVQLAYRPSVAGGRYCIIVLDPAAITPEDGLPSVIQPMPMTVPVESTLTVGVSGPGASVSAGQ